MKFTVHAESLSALHQAVQSQCDTIRYGADLCELKLPSDSQVQHFIKQMKNTDKEFCYVCPRLPEHLFSVAEKHLQMINAETTQKMRIISNDWGIINLIIDGKYPNLVPYMGRQLVSIPNRGQPSIAALMGGENLFRQFAAKKLGGIVFNKTNLHFDLTSNFLLEHNIAGADIDWVPETFGEMKSIVKRGLAFSVHLGLLIVAVVRRCHTARYFDEPIPESCSMPCFRTSFLLKQNVLGDMYMDGNTIFKMNEPTQKDMKQLFANNPMELVMAMGPMTQIQTSTNIDARIAQLKTYIS